MFARLRRHIPFLAIILLASVVVTRHIWSTRSIIETHDGIFHIIRITEMTEMVRLGQFPVRWAGNLDNGFGLPLFNYVYPGPYYLALPFTLMGLSAKWAFKLLIMGSYLLGALGIYALFANSSKKRAWFASLLYLTTPYLLVNVFVRGALGELMAISLIPWVILSLDSLSKGTKLAWYHPLPYFFLFLSHNFLSFLFLPIFLLYLVTHKHSRSALTSFVLSFSLAAFFLLPMIFERNQVLSFSSGDFTYVFRDHFLYLSQLIYSKWGTGYSVQGLGDNISFQLGIPHLILTILAIVGVTRRKLGRETKLWLLALAGTIFYTTKLSLPVWQLLSPLQIIQFPWRFLALSTVILALIGYYSIFLFRPSRIRVLVASLLLVVGFVFAYLYSTPSYLQNPDQFTTQLYIHRNKTTTSSRSELLPRWTTGDEVWKGPEELRIYAGQADLTLLDSSPVTLALSSITQDPATRYLIRRHYFPSWAIHDELGSRISIEPSEDGEILFSPDTGTHEYRLSLISTPIELISNTISLLTIIGIIAYTYVKKDSHQTKRKS